MLIVRVTDADYNSARNCGLTVVWDVQGNAVLFLRVRPAPYPVQLDGVDPLVPVLGVLGAQVPHAVVHADVQPALVKLVGLRRERESAGF